MCPKMVLSASELFQKAAERRAKLNDAQKVGLKKRKPLESEGTPKDLQHAKTLRSDESSAPPEPQ